MAFWRMRMGGWMQNTAGTTIFTQVLLLAVAIASIANNILAMAFCAAVDMSFRNHGGEVNNREYYFSPNLHKIM